MRYLGLDLGTKTLGLALSDPLGMIASSYKILKHDEDYDRLILLLKEEVQKNHVQAFVLGLPKNMNNSIGERGELALMFQKKLTEAFSLPVYMQDERLTTKQAEDLLIANHTSRKKRKKVIDSLAATIILQSYLDRRER